MGVLTSRRSGGPQTGTAVSPSSPLIRRGPILHQAAAIPLRPALTLRLAAATAAEAATEAIGAVMGEGEARAAMAVVASTVVVAVEDTRAAGAALTVQAGAALTAVEAEGAAPTAVAADRIGNLRSHPRARPEVPGGLSASRRGILLPRNSFPRRQARTLASAGSCFRLTTLFLAGCLAN